MIEYICKFYRFLRWWWIWFTAGFRLDKWCHLGLSQNIRRSIADGIAIRHAECQFLNCHNFNVANKNSIDYFILFLKSLLFISSILSIKSHNTSHTIWCSRSEFLILYILISDLLSRPLINLNKVCTWSLYANFSLYKKNRLDCNRVSE